MAKKATTPSSQPATPRKADGKTKPIRGGTTNRQPNGGKNGQRPASPATTKPASPRRSASWQLPKLSSFRWDWEQKALLVGVFLIFFTAIILLSLLSPNQGQLTTAMSNLVWIWFGWGGAIIPLFLGGTGFYLVLWGMEQAPKLSQKRLIGIGLLFLAFELFASLIPTLQETGITVWQLAEQGQGGGYLGGLLAWGTTTIAGTIATIILWAILGILATILATSVSKTELLAIAQLLQKWVRQLTTPPAQPLPADQPQQLDQPLSPPAINRPTPTTPVRQRTTPNRQPSTTNDPSPATNNESVPEVFAETPDTGQTWKLPKTEDMLNAGTDRATSNDLTIRQQSTIIEETLRSLSAPARIVDISTGPTVTQYGVEPLFIEQRNGKSTKVKVGKIAGLADDLALALAAKAIRIQAPVPGQGYIGIEVPNPDKAIVSLRDVMESETFQKMKSPLRIGLGENVSGQAICAELTKMPHLLIAGATGAGKSVCVNGIIACLLLQHSPDNLRFVMVDPKRVELVGYNGIPHLIAPVVVDMERVVGTLQWAQREMDMRYQKLAAAGVRNIVEYNKKIAKEPNQEKLPYIVIIIDELADLMMMAPEDTEKGITRLAQMARATGIHMILATQRPSVDVVTGLIKANFPARIAFAVASSIDSRVILDTVGAERLLGQGDMLFQSPDAASPIRMQGCYVSDRELQKLIDHWQAERRQNLLQARQTVITATEPIVPVALPITPPAPSPTNNEHPSTNHSLPTTNNYQQPATNNPPPALWEDLIPNDNNNGEEDELLPEAIEMVRKLNKASTSLLQRRFRVGYTRAARLMDVMEERGVVGPPTGATRMREVLAWQPNNETSENTPLTEPTPSSEL